MVRHFMLLYFFSVLCYLLRIIIPLPNPRFGLDGYLGSPPALVPDPCFLEVPARVGTKATVL